MTCRAVIVDDEPLARERLRTLLTDEPDFRVVAECADGQAAVSCIEESHPDVVFLDVQLPEMDGFEVLDSLGEGTAPVVVFVTAFERHAIATFDASAADYLLKPFYRARFRRTMERVRTRLGAGMPREELRAVLAQVRGAGARQLRFVIRQRGRLLFVWPQEIDRIESAGNYVRLHCGKTSHLYRETLSQLERRLDPALFVRVHRSTIVNLERIRTVQPHFHGEYILTLTDGTRLTSSRTYSGRLRELLR